MLISRNLLRVLAPVTALALAACSSDDGEGTDELGDTGFDTAEIGDTEADSSDEQSDEALDPGPEIDVPEVPDATGDVPAEVDADTGSELLDTGDDVETGDVTDTSDAADTDAGDLCGNSVIDPGEACDDGPTGSATCDEFCATIECGDGVVNGDEACDDGNEVLLDGCDNSCNIEYFLRGAVEFQGRPLMGVPITLELLGTDGTRIETAAMADGSFLFADLEPGEWRLGSAYTEGWTLVTESAGSEADTVVLDDSHEDVVIAVTSSYFPAQRDAAEPDSAAAGGVAQRVQVDGAWAARSLYPAGETDAMVFALEAGVEYEIFTTALSYAGDTYMELFGVGSGTVLAEGDDYIVGDSRIVFTPTVSGDYFVNIEGFPRDCNLTSYLFGVATLVDVDGDGWSATYDCDDRDDSVFPTATEIAGDGVDQNCDGADAPLPSIADAIPASSRATALAIEPSYLEPAGRLWFGDIAERDQRTLANSSAEDWLRYDLAPNEKIALFMRPAVGGEVTIDVFVDDAAEPLLQLAGFTRRPFGYTDDAGHTLYFRFRADAAATYLPVVVPLGFDLDGDSYTLDSNPIDLDDADPLVGSCLPDEG